MNQAERRKYDFEVRATAESETEAVLEGRAVVCESMTDLGCFKEIIHKGALDKTDLTDVRFLVNHDLSRIPLARSRKNTKNSTMQLIKDDDGLGVRVNLDTGNNTEAKNLYSAVERGDISGMSFMFYVNDEEWEDLDSAKPTRHINEIGKIVEVSAVTQPAYEDTELSARNAEAVDTARRAVDTARSASSVDTDSLNLYKAKNKNLCI